MLIYYCIHHKKGGGSLYCRSFLDKLENKFGKFAINNLMPIIIGAMGIVFIMDLFISSGTGYSVISMLDFNRSAIFAGQVWRILTFIFIPPESSIIFIIFALYFYWILGSALENNWGAFRFNLFYFCGILCSIITGFITGYATNYYLNMSLFLAFAALYPDFEILLFFVLPLKMKYLAIVDVVLLALTFFRVSWVSRIALLVSFVNLLIFIFPNFIRLVKNLIWKIKYKFKTRK